MAQHDHFMDVKGVRRTMSATFDAKALQALLVPGQLRCLLRIDEARSRSLDRRHFTYDARFQPEDSRLDAPTDPPPASLGGGGLIWAGSLDFQQKPPWLADPGMSRRVIASVSLWPNVPESCAWLDFLCLARDPATQALRILPVELEEVAPAGDGELSVHHVLTLPELATEGLELRQLQDVFADFKRVVWAYEYEGLGVFVVVLVSGMAHG
jgi:hypothetical protein